MLIAEEITKTIIGAGIEVHRVLGPGLLESAYEECLCYELRNRGLEYQRQVPLPIIYKEVKLNCGYQIDLVVQNMVIIELKAVELLSSIHEAQLLTYLRLSGQRVGLLMNFNCVVLRDGIVRRVL